MAFSKIGTNLQGLGNDLFEGFSIPRNLENAAQTLHDLRLPSVIIHVKYMIAHDSLSARIAALTSLIELYSKRPTVKTIMSYGLAIPDIIALFRAFHPDDIAEINTDSSRPMAQYDAKNEEVKIDELKFDPTKGSLSIKEQLETSGNKKFWVENQRAITILAGLATMLCCMTGITKAITFDSVQTAVKSIADLSKLAANTKTLWSAVQAFLVPALKFLYSLFGTEYLTQEEAATVAFSMRVQACYDRAMELQTQLRLDFFGFRTSDLAKIEQVYKALVLEQHAFAEEKKSNYNWTAQLHSIDEVIRQLRSFHTDLQQATAGKQEPVTIWFCGPPNAGKTRSGNELSQRLAALTKQTVYTRNTKDQFWSSYVGQPVVCYDDLGQYSSGDDVAEWFSFCGGAARSTVGAALADKGQPFSAKWMVVSSNLMWIGDGKQVMNLEAANRRRDIVVYMYFPEISEYKQRHGGSPPPEGDEFWRTYKPKYYLINPVYGFDEGRSKYTDRLKFTPADDYVLFETSLDEIQAIAQNLEMARREEFRVRMKAAYDDVDHPLITIPTEPFKVQPDLFISNMVARRKMLRSNKRVEYILSSSEDEDDVTSLRLQPAQQEAFLARYGVELGDMNCTPQEAIMRVKTSQKCVYVMLNGRIAYHPQSATAIEEGRTRTLFRKGNYGFVNIVKHENGLQLTFHQSEGSEPLQGIAKVDRYSYKCIATLIVGDPGTGKTYFAENCSEHSYLVEDEQTLEDLPKDKVLIFDDITVSFERFAKFKQAVCKFYQGNPLKWKYVIGTANPKTVVWDRIPKDDLGMLTRRCHNIRIDFGWYSMIKTWDPTEADLKTREKYLNVTIDLNKESSCDFGQCQQNLECVMQVMKLEADHDPSQLITPVYNELRFPSIPTPQFVIGMKDKHRVAIDNFTLMKRQDDGGYQKVGMCEMLDLAAELAPSLKFLVDLSVLDLQTLTSTVNARKIQLTKKIENFVVQVDTEQICGVNVDGTLILFVASEDHKVVQITKTHMYVTYPDGAKSYSLDEEQDRIFAAHLAKWNNIRAPDLPPLPSQEELLKASAPHTILNEIIGAIDILLTTTTVVTLAGASIRKTDADKIVHNEQELIDFCEWKCDYKPYTSQEDDVQFEARGGRKHVQRRGKDQSYFSPEEVDSFQRDAIQYDDKGPYILEYDPRTGQMVKRYLKNESAQQHLLKRVEEPIEYTSMYIAAYYDKKNEEMRYGILLEDDFFFWHRYRTNSWRFQSCKSNQVPFFNVCERSDFWNCHQYLTTLRGKTLANPQWGEIPVDQIFANYVAKGKFAAIEYNKDYSFAREIINLCGEPPRTNADSTRAEGAYDIAAQHQNAQIAANRVDILNEDGEFINSGIMIKDKYGITVSHSFASARYIAIDDSRYEIRSIKNLPNDDFAIFEVISKDYRPLPKILQHIPTLVELESFATATEGKFNAFMTQKGKVPIAYKISAELNVTRLGNPGNSIRTSLQLENIGCSGITTYGDCGSPLVAISPTLNHKFIGIHNRGSDAASFAVLLHREMIEKHLPKNESSEAMTVGIVGLNKQEKSDTPMGILSAGTLHGRWKSGVHIPTRTKEYKTPIEIDSGYQPTVKSVHDPRNPERENMLVSGVKRYLTPHPGKEEGIKEEVEYAAKCVGNYLADLISSQGLETRVLSNTEAINGPNPIHYSASKTIDRSGAVGWPYCVEFPNSRTKGDYLIQRGALWYYDTEKKEGQKLLSDVDNLFDHARRGIHHEKLFIAYLKDEPVKDKKCAPPNLKTRVFFAGPYDYQMAYRRFFGAAIWRITELFHDHPIKVGINASGPEWEYLIRKMLAKGQRGFASDMENWDGTVPLEFLEAVTTVYNTIYRQTDPDWKEEDDLARKTLHRTIEGAYVLVKDKVIKLNQAMPSGYPGTATENSIINWMLFYCVYARLMKRNGGNPSFQAFMNDTELAVYGDDNMVAVRSDIENAFHFNSFKQEARKFGFSVTDALKTGEQQPDLVPVKELDFLKRHTIEMEGNLFGALDVQSIRKMLQWSKSSPAYEYDGQWRILQQTGPWIEAIPAIMHELAAHGRTIYYQEVEHLRNALKGKKLKVVIPSFEDAIQHSYH